MAKKNKFYAVAIGKKPAIYESWAECEKQTKGFAGARFKSFASRADAQEFMNANAAKDSDQAAARPAKRSRPNLYPRVTIHVYFDGGARGSTGASGAGAHVEIATEQSDGVVARKTVQVRKYLGTSATNNIAEYNGLLCGLEEATKATKVFKGISKNDGIRLKVIGDSDLVVQQMNGTYQCKSENLLPLLGAAQSLVTQMEQTAPMDISFEHVYRKDNSMADALANEAMDSGKSWTTTKDEVMDGDGIASGDEAKAASVVDLVGKKGDVVDV